MPILAAVAGAVGCNPMPTPPPAVDGLAPEKPVWREAFDASQLGFMSAVWGSSPRDVYVVGGQPDEGVIVHFDGSEWNFEEIPRVAILVWVFGFAQDDIFAVGEQGGILHFDGSRWDQMPGVSSDDLWGVWGAAPDDVWAVGGEIDTGPPVIRHFNGVSWTEVAVPAIDRPSTALLKVWGTGPNQVFAVGQSGLIIEYDGTQWRQANSGTSEDLISLWGTGTERIVAVGGRSNGTIAVFDGQTWTTQSAAPLAGLNGVFLTQPREAIVVGLFGTAATVDPITRIPQTETTGVAMTLHAVWGDGRGSVYAVGGDPSESQFQGVVLRRTLEPVESLRPVHRSKLEGPSS